MGYTIVYDKAFVKDSMNRIMPLVLCGSSNCTESINGKEVLERAWNVFYNDEMLGMNPSALMDKVRTLHPETSDNECFKYRGKWMHDKDVVSFFEKGIKDAMTIEEVRSQQPNQRLVCRVIAFDGDFKRIPNSMDEYIQTTQELEKWVVEAKSLCEFTQKSGYNCYISMCFHGREPLRLYHGDTNCKVVAKCKHGYVVKYEKDSISYSKRVDDAMVFDSTDDAIELLPKSFGPYRFAKAENAKKEKDFVIKITDGEKAGYFINKLTSRQLSFSYTAKAAGRRFTTEKEAEKYWASHIAGRFHGCKDFEAVKIDA